MEGWFQLQLVPANLLVCRWTGRDHVSPPCPLSITADRAAQHQLLPVSLPVGACLLNCVCMPECLASWLRWPVLLMWRRSRAASADLAAPTSVNTESNLPMRHPASAAGHLQCRLFRCLRRAGLHRGAGRAAHEGGCWPRGAQGIKPASCHRPSSPMQFAVWPGSSCGTLAS